MPRTDISDAEFPGFLNDASTDVAKRLLGCILVRTLDDGSRIVARIVETESYDQYDAASHSYRGQTPRTEVMFGPAGFAYVYFTYGMHYCCNVVTGAAGEGSAVLFRAVEIIEGKERAEALRGRTLKNPYDLSNGPAKLCYALGIDKRLNKHDYRKPPLQLISQAPVADEDIVTTTRIGIKEDVEALRRFYITGNPYVSVK